MALSTKAELVGCLLSHWQFGIFYVIKEFGTSVSALTLSISEQVTQPPPFVLLKYLKKTFDSLSDYNTYLRFAHTSYKEKALINKDSLNSL